MPQCPECAEDITGEEPVCPHCKSILKKSATPVHAPRQTSKSTYAIGAISVVVILLMVVLTLWNGRETREVARRSQAKANLKQIGQAMQSYHDAHQEFPPGSVVDGQGAAQQGWEALLLPYLNQASLYDQIDFNKPWDDPRNMQVFQNEVPDFIDPSYVQKRDAGGLPVSHFGANPLALPSNRGLQIREITDGLNNTIMAGNMAAGERGWGTPFNLRDPSLGINTGPDSLGSPHPGGALVLMCDGSVRFLRSDLPLLTLQRLSTPHAGDYVDSGF